MSDNINLGRRKLLILAGALITSPFYIPNSYAHNLEFKLTGTLNENFEIVKSLSPEEFHLLYKNLGFRELRNLIRDTTCPWYPKGHERVENMRRLLPFINKSSNKHNLSANRVFSHVFIESGGDNNLNCEGGGGVMHLLDYHWAGINPLNEEQNIQRGVEYIDELKREFQDEDIASMAYNQGPGKKKDPRYGIRAEFYKIRDFFNSKGWGERKTNYGEVIWSMKRNSPNLALFGENYVNNLNKAWEVVVKQKLFEYNPEKNLVKYIGLEGGIKFKQPKPPRFSKKLFKK